MKKTVAILGANSHIANGLIANIIKTNNYKLYCYTQNVAKFDHFYQKVGLQNYQNNYVVVKNGYDDFLEPIFKYDIIINCIGCGIPSKMKDFTDWFTITEEYDNKCIKYLVDSNPDAHYISFSSGNVYGNSATEYNDNTTNCVTINNILPEMYYSIAKVNSEAKHRAFHKYNMIDLRIFSYFSQYMDLSGGYLMSDILKSLINKQTFQTNDTDIMRDFIYKDDLFELIIKVTNVPKINMAIDVKSLSPISKFEIINYYKEYHGLIVEVTKNIKNFIHNTSNKYFATRDYPNMLEFHPKFKSIDTIMLETQKILSRPL